MSQKLVLLLNILITVMCTEYITDDLIVRLPNGKVLGKAYVTDHIKVYYGFRAIPYATPPVGDLRLEPPEPAQPWTELLDGRNDSKICISSAYLAQPEQESEDCLYINVYIPALEPVDPLPVMFWIYGGAFTDGSSLKSLYGPDFLMQKDVIVVTFNYRLGPLGFISTEDAVLPGNLGLKDQVLALKWTYENIVHFGGDPEKITIFGQSAGATSVGLHLVSKKSRGLFRAAILESGSALVHWSVDWEARKIAYQIADAIPGGNYGNDTEALKAFLKNRTVEEIATAYGKLPAGVHPYPTIEPESDDAFISESHYELLASGDFNQVPIMIGITSEESLMALKNLENAKKIGQAFDDAPETLIPDDLRPSDDDVPTVIAKIKSTYLNESESETFANNLVALAEYYSDNRYARGVIKHAEIQSNFTPVYLYEFSYYGDRIITPAFIDGAGKAGHAAELPYLFNIDHGLGSSDSNDLLIQDRLVTMWTNFATFLNPTPEKTELVPVLWPTTSAYNLQYFNINATLQIEQNIRRYPYEQWNDIYETYGSKPFITF